MEWLLQRLEAKRQARDPGRLRDLRALQVLELAGGADARRALATLAQGALDARLTREAKAALERLASRPVSAP